MDHRTKSIQRSAKCGSNWQVEILKDFVRDELD